MASLTITVPDAVVPRIRVAMGREDPSNPGTRINATVEDIQTAIKQFIKSQVINYETTLAAMQKRDTVSQETW